MRRLIILVLKHQIIKITKIIKNIQLVILSSHQCRFAGKKDLESMVKFIETGEQEESEEEEDYDEDYDEDDEDDDFGDDDIEDPLEDDDSKEEEEEEDAHDEL